MIADHSGRHITKLESEHIGSCALQPSCSLGLRGRTEGSCSDSRLFSMLAIGYECQAVDPLLHSAFAKFGEFL